MDYSNYKNLIIERKDRIAIITMNRPESLNAIDADFHRELTDAFYQVGRDDDIWVVILTGRGKAFCSGGDVRWFKRYIDDPGANPLVPLYEPVQLLNNIINMPQPIIAAMNGPGVGLGATLAMFCDIIIASEDAHFSDPHVRVGAVAGDGGCAIWPLLMGMAKAKEYLFTGDVLSAKEAERMGVINKVVPADQLMSQAMSFAQRLAASAPLALKYTKLAVNRVLMERLNLIVPYSIACEYLYTHTKDFGEGVNAFLQKRTPKFTGD